MRATTFGKISFLALWVLLLGAHPAAAQILANEPEQPETAHERWYQVEMIAFSRGESTSPKSENAYQKENWPKNIQLAYPANLVALQPPEAIDPNGFVQLKSGERQLNAQAASIAKNGSYTLLFHQAWRQLINSNNLSILINGGKSYSGHQELEGSIDLHVGQYLQLQTNLWFTQFVSAQAATAADSGWPELPAIPRGELGNGEMRISEVLSSDQPADYVSRRTVKIDQKRSLRSGEVHYIDHPLLGIIVKIVPYDAPTI